MSEVGSGQVAIFPTFKGFRSAVSKETDAAAKDSDKGFRQAFSKTGSESGKQTGSGFKKAFEGESKGFSTKATKELEQSVAKSASAVSKARLKEQDAAGKVRVAERQLAEARDRYAKDSSQVIRAEERLATANRQLDSAQDDTKKSTNELRTAQQKLADAANDAADELGDAGGRGASRFKSGFSAVFQGSFFGATLANLVGQVATQVGQAIGDGLQAGFRFVVGTIDLASGLEQSVGAVDAIFKDSADVIHGWAQSAAEDVGLSQGKFNELATIVGAQLKNMGIPLEEATAKTGDLVQLGADLAAQFGGQTSDAVSAISSLLRGERDPIERYGVSLKQADIDARLAAEGLSELEGEALKQAEAQAALAILYEQTADAQGTFAAESDTLAGKQQRLNAAWEDAQTKIGEAFMPIAAELASVLLDDIMPVIAELVDKYGPELGAMFADAAPAFAELAQDLLPKLPGMFESMAESLPGLIDAAADLAPIVLDIVTAFADLVTGVSEFFSFVNGDSTPEEFVERLLVWPGVFGDVNRAVADFFAGFASWLGDASTEVGNFAADVDRNIQDVIAWFVALPQRIGETVAGIGDWLYNAGKDLIQGFIDGINASFGAVGDAISGVLNWVGGFFPSSPAKQGPFAGAGWTRLKHSGGAVMEQFTSGMARPDLTGALSPAYSTAVTLAPSGSSAVPVQHVHETIQLTAPNGRVLFEVLREYMRSA